MNRIEEALRFRKLFPQASFTPCQGKRAVLKGWQERPQESLEELQYFAEDGNIAIRTGARTGIVLLDLDEYKQGGVSRDFLEQLPETVTVITGGGGRQLYFAAPRGWAVGNSRTRFRFPRNVDVRGNGGYAVFPGSVHPDTGQPYRFAPALGPGEVELAAWPFEPGTPYGLGAWRMEADRLACAVKGERNDTLNKVAYNLFRLCYGGELQLDHITCKLAEIAASSGLTAEEVRKTLESARASAEKNPRRAPPKPERGRLDPDRPTIKIAKYTPDLTIEFMEDRIGEIPGLFKKGGNLVRVLEREGAPCAAAVSPEALKGLIRPTAIWMGLSAKEEWVAVAPPLEQIRAIVTSGVLSTVPRLRGISRWPVMRPDGTFRMDHGYDERTEYFVWLPEGGAPIVPLSPSESDARTAVEALQDAVCDFPFASDVDFAAWCAALLTPIVRPLIPVCPFFLVTSNLRGTGKSKLFELVVTILSGRTAPATPWPGGRGAAEELGKQITATLLAGKPFLFFDNLPNGGSLSAPVLDALATSPFWEGRVLGKTETTGELPNVLTCLATGNNIAVSGDTSRRVVVTRLETNDAAPWTRHSFKRPRLLKWAREARSALLGAAMTILAAHARAGRPRAAQAASLGSFEDWAELVRDALMFAGLPDVAEAIGANRGDVVDDEGDGHCALLLEWHRVQRGHVGGLTTTEVLGIAERDAELREAIESFAGPGALRSSRSLGRRLAAVRDTPKDVGSEMRMKFSHVRSGHARKRQWSVIMENDPAECGRFDHNDRLMSAETTALNSNDPWGF